MREGVIPALKVARTALTWLVSAQHSVLLAAAVRTILPMLLIDQTRDALRPYESWVELLACL